MDAPSPEYHQPAPSRSFISSPRGLFKKILVSHFQLKKEFQVVLKSYVMTVFPLVCFLF